MRRCAKSTAAAPASARTAGQVAPASAASATRGPALVLPLGCVTSRLRLSCSGLTRGTQRECDPDLCLHVSVHVARRPRLRYSKMSSSAVRSVPAPGRGCGTRSNGRPVASSRLRLGVLHSEKNAVAATSGSKLVSTRSDSTRVGFKTVTEADDCCACAAFVAWPVGSSWVGRLRQGTYQEASVHPRVRRRGER